MKRLFAIVLFMIAFSCSDEDVNVLPDDQGTLDVEEARQWFESQSRNSSSGRIKGEMIPRWDKAEVGGATLEVPYTLDGKVSLPHTGNGFQGRNRLLIHKRGETLASYLISYVPAGNKGNDFKSVNFRNFKAKKFTGKILIQPLNGVYLEERIYEDGVLQNGHKTNSSGRVQQWWEQCTDWYQWGGNEYSYLDTTCDTWFEGPEPGGNYSVDPTWPYGGGGGIFYVNDPFLLNCIQNQMQIACLKQVVDKVVNPNIVGTFNSLIQGIFNTDDKVNLIFQEGSNLDGTARAFPPVRTGDRIDITIKVDPALLNGISEQFFAAIVIHESFHAIVYYLSNSQVSATDEHVAMFTNYLNMLAEGLDNVYGGQMGNVGDSRALILQQLLLKDGGPNNSDAGKWDTAFVEKVLSFSNFTRDQVTIVQKRYNEYHTSGTRLCD